MLAVPDIITKVMQYHILAKKYNSFDKLILDVTVGSCRIQINVAHLTVEKIGLSLSTRSMTSTATSAHRGPGPVVKV